MKLLHFVFLFLAPVQVESVKRFDINRILRIQMARLRHQYDIDKNTKTYQLKDESTRMSIKKELMEQFLKVKDATLQKVRLHKLRLASLRMAQKRIKRSDIKQAIGSSRLNSPGTIVC